MQIDFHVVYCSYHILLQNVHISLHWVEVFKVFKFWSILIYVCRLGFAVLSWKGIFLEKIKHLKTHRIWCLVFVFLIYPIITIVRGCWQRSCLNTCFVVKRSDVTAKIWFKVNIDSPHCAEQSWSPTRWGFYLVPLTVTK